MKLTRWYACMMLLAFALVCMTGCNNRDTTGNNATTGTTAATTTTQPVTTAAQSTTNSTTGDATKPGTTTNKVDESSTGVINGLMNDVEQGVDNLETKVGVTE